jgi:uncharacterized membrane protein YphA (DoxX/SURF4 family)
LRPVNFEIAAIMENLERAKWAALPLRLVMGTILSVAGYMKLVAMAGTIEYFAKQGFPIPVATAWFITLLELCGGIALILGLFVRYLGLLYTIEFIVAAFWVKLPTQGVHWGAARSDAHRRRRGAVHSRSWPLVHRLRVVRETKAVKITAEDTAWLSGKPKEITPQRHSAATPQPKQCFTAETQSS